MDRILGLHHMTAIAGDAQSNVDFYVGVLGLRLIKITVNFDDPSAYHLYYGDGVGTPGSTLTFFPYPGGYRGKRGPGQVVATALSIPPNSIGYWTERLRAQGAEVSGVTTRGGAERFSFEAPDGLLLELLANPEYRAGEAWAGSVVPSEHAIARMHSVTLSEANIARTKQMLEQSLGLAMIWEEGPRSRYALGEDFIDLLDEPNGQAGGSGHGSVHHVAFRTTDEATQLRWRDLLVANGSHVSPVMDRDYFHSIYFREPGGVLFEIATDLPGFAIDEPLEALGGSLRLPASYEPYRDRIEASLPKLRMPKGER